jgi:hypothetical protein
LRLGNHPACHGGAFGVLWPARLPSYMNFSNVIVGLASGIAVTLCGAAEDPFPTTLPRSLLTSPYVLDRISFTLTEDTSLPIGTGRTVQELVEATGGAIFHDLTFVPGERFLNLRLSESMKLGAAFRAAQKFDFGAQSRWKIKSIEPDLRGFFGSYQSVRRVFNTSTLAEVRTGETLTIGGLVVPGNYAQLVIIKVRGSSLSAFGVQQPLSNPTLQLYQGNLPILQNDDWTTLAQWEKALAAECCTPPDNPLEPMIVTYLDPGAYTAVVSGVGGAKGTALLEMYILDWFVVMMPESI